MPTLGASATLYYQDASAAWHRIDNVRDLTVALEAGTFDETPADSGGWKASGTGPISATLQWEMVWDNSDPALLALRDAFLSGDTIALQALDGDVGSPDAVSGGMVMPCEIVRFQRPERASSAMLVSILAKPTVSEDTPAWLEALIDIDNGETVWDIDADEAVVAEAA